MKRSICQMMGAVLLGVIFYSCEPSEEPFNEQDVHLTEKDVHLTEQDIKPAFMTAEILSNCEQLPDYGEFKDVNTYTVQFLERKVADGGATTTFRYKVSGNGETPQLDSFYLEVPECTGPDDPISWFPEQSSNLIEGAIKWNSSVSKNRSQEYSITYKGIIPLGFINATITRGNIIKTEKILGPCREAYTVEGKIFIDANSDGSRQASESGIQDIQVTLYNSGEEDTPATSFCTTKDGSYSFLVPKGSYLIKVEDFLNEGDDEGYTARSTSTSEFNVNGSLSDINFGFIFKTTKVVDDLKSGKLEVNTKPTKFWINEVRNAGKKNATYSENDILIFLNQIELLFLDSPFQFGTDKRGDALDILSRPIKSDLDEYLQQLLTAELNVVSGRGAQLGSDGKNMDFNYSLLNYAEAVACREIETCPAGGVSAEAVSSMRIVSLNDTEMLRSFNGSGGI